MALKKRLLLIGLVTSLIVQAAEPLYNYSFFYNSRMAGSYFYSETESSGSSQIKNTAQKLPVDKNIFHTPGNSLQLSFRNAKDGNWKAAVYRQQIRGQDHFKAPNFLSFWIYTASASTKSKDLPSVHLVNRDSSVGATFYFNVEANNSWKNIIIPLDPTSFVNDPQSIIGIGFTQNNRDDKEHTVYIDDIEFIPEKEAVEIKATPFLNSAHAGPKHIDIAWKPVKESGVNL